MFADSMKAAALAKISFVIVAPRRHRSAESLALHRAFRRASHRSAESLVLHGAFWRASLSGEPSPRRRGKGNARAAGLKPAENRRFRKTPARVALSGCP